MTLVLCTFATDKFPSRKRALLHLHRIPVLSEATHLALRDSLIVLSYLTAHDDPKVANWR